MVLKVGGGHNCWVADPSACAATMLAWIQAWIGAGSASTTSITLVAPPVQAAGGGKQFPADADHRRQRTSFQSTVCAAADGSSASGCHTSSSATAQQPYFASADVNEAYAAAQPKINLDHSEPVALRACVCATSSTTAGPRRPGGAPDCPGSARPC